MASVKNVSVRILVETGAIPVWRFHRLLYLCQVLYLEQEGKLLVEEDFLAEENGPVCVALQDSSDHGNSTVETKEQGCEGLSAQEEEAIRRAIEVFGSVEDQHLADIVNDDELYEEAWSREDGNRVIDFSPLMYVEEEDYCAQTLWDGYLLECMDNEEEIKRNPDGYAYFGPLDINFRDGSPSCMPWIKPSEGVLERLHIYYLLQSFQSKGIKVRDKPAEEALGKVIQRLNEECASQKKYAGKLEEDIEELIEELDEIQEEMAGVQKELDESQKELDDLKKTHSVLSKEFEKNLQDLLFYKSCYDKQDLILTKESLAEVQKDLLSDKEYYDK